jgi:hypothetical protein
LHPAGEPRWQWKRVKGTGIPDALAGVMCNLERYASGEDDVLVTRVDDALMTMNVVESCYESSRAGATRLAMSPDMGGP